MAELQVLTLATNVADVALSTLLVVNYIIRPACAPPLIGASSSPLHVATVFLTIGRDCLLVLLVPSAASAPQLAAVRIQTRWHTAANRLAVALVVTIKLVLLITTTRHLPPALYHCWGGTIMTTMLSLTNLTTSYDIPSHLPMKGDSTTSLSLGG